VSSVMMRGILGRHGGTLWGILFRSDLLKKRQRLDWRLTWLF
jgi:hypothetical protein